MPVPVVFVLAPLLQLGGVLLVVAGALAALTGLVALLVWLEPTADGAGSGSGRDRRGPGQP